LVQLQTIRYPKAGIRAFQSILDRGFLRGDGRRPEEQPEFDLLAFYRQFLGALRRGEWFQGAWRLRERMGWEDNASYLSLVSW
jgi:hypothetical protein